MNKKHGMVDSLEYKSWSMMKVRCTNKRNAAYPRYGGRGIKICKRWFSFENFFADMGRRPSAKHSLDRIDNNGDYTPNNCRWATAFEQGKNKRNNKIITFNGKSKCISEWEKITGIKRRTIQARLMHGWTVKNALTVSVMSMSEAGKLGGIARHAK